MRGCSTTALSGESAAVPRRTRDAARLKALQELDLFGDLIGDKGYTALLEAIDGGGMPLLERVGMDFPRSTAMKAVEDAVERNKARRDY